MSGGRARGREKARGTPIRVPDESEVFGSMPWATRSLGKTAWRWEARRGASRMEDSPTWMIGAADRAPIIAESRWVRVHRGNRGDHAATTQLCQRADENSAWSGDADDLRNWSSPHRRPGADTGWGRGADRATRARGLHMPPAPGTTAVCPFMSPCGLAQGCPRSARRRCFARSVVPWRDRIAPPFD
jgi:hypothetical protein